MAGLLSPYDSYELISALKNVMDIPVQLHTHYTSGMASMSCLKAIEAGVDVIDTCMSPLALRTSQPAIEPLLVSLSDTEYDLGLDRAESDEPGGCCRPPERPFSYFHSHLALCIRKQAYLTGSIHQA